MENGQNPLTGENNPAVNSAEINAPGPDHNRATRHRHIIALFHPADRISGPDRKQTRDLIEQVGRSVKSGRKETEVDLWLQADGGDIDAVYKLVSFIRGQCRLLRLVIPDRVKGAAALFAVAADEIVMGRESELGPLDSDLPHPEREDISLSALEIVGAVDDFMRRNIQSLLRDVPQCSSHAAISRQDALTVLLDYAAQITGPMMSKIDPVMMQKARNKLNSAQDYCRRLLQPHLDRHRSDEDMISRMENLPDKLTTEYLNRQFVITPDEAIELGLPVVGQGEYDYWPQARQLCRAVDSKDRIMTVVFAAGDIDRIVPLNE